MKHFKKIRKRQERVICSLPDPVFFFSKPQLPKKIFFKVHPPQPTKDFTLS